MIAIVISMKQQYNKHLKSTIQHNKLPNAVKFLNSEMYDPVVIASDANKFEAPCFSQLDIKNDFSQASQQQPQQNINFQEALLIRSQDFKSYLNDTESAHRPLQKLYESLKQGFHEYSFIPNKGTKANKDSAILRVIPPIDNRTYKACVNKLYLAYQLQRVIQANAPNQQQNKEYEIKAAEDLTAEYQRVNQPGYLEPIEEKTIQKVAAASIYRKKKGRPSKVFGNQNHQEGPKSNNELTFDMSEQMTLKELCELDDKNQGNQGYRVPILGLSVYDERNLRNKKGRRFANLDKFVEFKLKEGAKEGRGSKKGDDGEEDFQYSAKDHSEPIQWRDKIFLEYQMEILDLLQSLGKMFESLNSFEIDPDNPNVIMGEAESKGLKKSVDRGLKWLMDKICQAKLEPIKVTLDDPGDSNDDIVDALTEKRSSTSIESLTKVYEVEKQPVYLTPQFLHHFDLKNALDRHYLKNRVRFNSIQLGFHARPYSNIIDKGKQIVPFRCWVGSTNWKVMKEKKKTQHYKNYGQEGRNSKVNYEEVTYCPFLMYYVRDIDPESGKPFTPFRLVKYNMVHSHPLSMDYERVSFDC